MTKEFGSSPSLATDMTRDPKLGVGFVERIPEVDTVPTGVDGFHLGDLRRKRGSLTEVWVLTSKGWIAWK